MQYYDCQNGKPEIIHSDLIISLFFLHEKLNGKGYPFGKTADELNKPERIMACIDIYQALTEDRPYKKGLSHDKACGILDDMAQKGFVDSDISNKIRDCFG